MTLHQPNENLCMFKKWHQAVKVNLWCTYRNPGTNNDFSTCSSKRFCNCPTIPIIISNASNKCSLACTINNILNMRWYSREHSYTGLKFTNSSIVLLNHPLCKLFLSCVEQAFGLPQSWKATGCSKKTSLSVKFHVESQVLTGLNDGKLIF